MNRSAQVIHNLRILGLPPDATPSDIRSAFRLLARTCHPDVAGRHSARRFEQITGAYSFLKSLAEEELQQDETRQNDVAWHQQRQQKQQKVREAEVARARELAVDTVLADGERAVADFLDRVRREAVSRDAREFVLRLSSEALGVRHLALSNLGALANQSAVLDATLSLLRRWDIDDKTARLVSQLPLDPENRHALARQLADRAPAVPAALLTYLLRLNTPHPRFDRALWEQYIREARADAAALLLRHWPQGYFVSDAALKRLLERKEESVLVPLLCAMKQRGVPCPAWCKTLLSAHLKHHSAGVRLWANALLQGRAPGPISPAGV